MNAISIRDIISILQLPKVGRKRAITLINGWIEVGNGSDTNGLKSYLKDSIPSITDENYLEAQLTADRILSKSEQKGIGVISYLDELYPKLLKQIPDFPIVLSYKGDIRQLDQKPTVAVIGTREPTEYGYKVGLRIGEIFAENGFNVISGLAKGCDTAGHVGALNAKGTTSAVLAHGLDHIYPKENKELAQTILDEGGVLLSEYFVETKAWPNNFVERDRIQAGLSQSVFVVETDITGGTMHTVKYCQEYRRRLACLNHPKKYHSFPKTHGNRMLIDENKAYAINSQDEIDAYTYLLLDDYLSRSDENDSLNIFYNELGYLINQLPDENVSILKRHAITKNKYTESFRALCTKFASNLSKTLSTSTVANNSSYGTLETSIRYWLSNIDKRKDPEVFEQPIPKLYAELVAEISNDLAKITERAKKSQWEVSKPNTTIPKDAHSNIKIKQSTMKRNDNSNQISIWQE